MVDAIELVGFKVNKKERRRRRERERERERKERRKEGKREKGKRERERERDRQTERKEGKREKVKKEVKKERERERRKKGKKTILESIKMDCNKFRFHIFEDRVSIDVKVVPFDALDCRHSDSVKYSTRKVVGRCNNDAIAIRRFGHLQTKSFVIVLRLGKICFVFTNLEKVIV